MIPGHDCNNPNRVMRFSIYQDPLSLHVRYEWHHVGEIRDGIPLCGTVCVRTEDLRESEQMREEYKKMVEGVLPLLIPAQREVNRLLNESLQQPEPRTCSICKQPIVGGYCRCT